MPRFWNASIVNDVDFIPIKTKYDVIIRVCFPRTNEIIPWRNNINVITPVKDSI